MFPLKLSPILDVVFNISPNFGIFLENPEKPFDSLSRESLSP